MNSLEQFFHALYNYDLAKERNRKKGRTATVKSPKLTMSFDFPDVDPPIVNAPHEILYDVEVEEEPSLYSDIRFCTSSPNCSFISNDEVTSEDVKMTDSSIDDMMTSESDYSILSQTTPSRTCYHPKHNMYEKEGLTTDTFVKITKNLAPIVEINDEFIICRGCMKQTHQDPEVYI